MKYLFLLIALISMACGKGGSTAAVSANPDKPAPGNPIASGPVIHVYTAQVTGDGTAFVFSMSANWNEADQQVGQSDPFMIVPAGQTLTYTVTGRNLSHIYLLRNSTPGAPLQAKLYEDGKLVEPSPLFYLAGEKHYFQDRDF